MASAYIAAQFEIGEDANGLARAAAYIAAQKLAGNATQVVATPVYSRESGISFMLVLMAVAGVTIGSGTLAAVGSVQVEVESGELDLMTLVNALNANHVASPALTHIQSVSIVKRSGGSAQLVAVQSN